MSTPEQETFEPGEEIKQDKADRIRNEALEAAKEDPSVLEGHELAASLQKWASENNKQFALILRSGGQFYFGQLTDSDTDTQMTIIREAVQKGTAFEELPEELQGVAKSAAEQTSSFLVDAIRHLIDMSPTNAPTVLANVVGGVAATSNSMAKELRNTRLQITELTEKLEQQIQAAEQ